MTHYNRQEKETSCIYASTNSEHKESGKVKPGSITANRLVMWSSKKELFLAAIKLLLLQDQLKRISYLSYKHLIYAISSHTSFRLKTST